MNKTRLYPRLICPNGLRITGSLLEFDDIDSYFKLDGSLVFVVSMDYATLTCDRGWINSRLTLSEGLHQVLDGKYSDIAFKVDNKTIKAHKVIVSRCQYFEAMLDGNNVESNTGIIEISDFKFEDFSSLFTQDGFTSQTSTSQSNCDWPLTNTIYRDWLRNAKITSLRR